MAAIPLCERYLAALKNSLRDEFPDAKSSHITEAMAYCLGFSKNASLSAALVGPENDRPIAVLSSQRMVERLVQLGYPPDPEFDFEMMLVTTDIAIDGLVSTMPDSAYDIKYKSPREKAWRNLMVCTVNAALDQKLFTLRPDDDRFEDNNRRGHLFDFVLPNGMAARGSVAQAGFGELKVHAAVAPKGDKVRYNDAGLAAGDAFGAAWVERRKGPWLQTLLTSFRCRKALVGKLAVLEAEPHGFGDRGKIIM